MIFCQIVEGAGRSTSGTSKPRVIPSHSASSARPNSAGIDDVMTAAARP